MKKKVTKAIIATMICCTLFLGDIMSVEAASSGWSLRYLKGAPSSENVLSWETYVTTTSNTTTIRVDSISGGAEVFMYTNNGIAALGRSAGASMSTPAKKGVRIYAYVKYNNCGSSTNYPSGTLVY